MACLPRTDLPESIPVEITVRTELENQRFISNQRKPHLEMLFYHQVKRVHRICRTQSNSFVELIWNNFQNLA